MKTIKAKKTNFIFKMQPAEEQKLLDALVKHGSVKIGKFGIFELREIKSRTGWDPTKRKVKPTEPYIKIAFRALTKSKNYVNNQMDTTK